MKITAVICEYNPFHLGHAYQISEMKKHGAVIALMSGSFTQRGTPAVLSKYERARIAVLCGADLVLELPFPFCSARAEDFGRAGVEILSALGCVDALCFGSESGDIEQLLTAETRLTSAEYQKTLEAIRKKSRTSSHHALSSEAYEALYGEKSPLSGSNDLLALSYLSALRKQNTSIRPYAIRRIGERYNGEGAGLASATTIRGLLEKHDWQTLQTAVPPVCADILRNAHEKGELCEEERLYPLFAALARTRPSLIADMPDIPAELADRMKKTAKTAKNTEEFLTLSATKLYSPSRIRRGMLYALSDVKRDDLRKPCHTTVLAANQIGRELLSNIRKTSRIPIVTKPADAKNFGEEVTQAFSLGAKADSLWTLLLQNPKAGDSMMREKPRML